MGRNRRYRRRLPTWPTWLVLLAIALIAIRLERREAPTDEGLPPTDRPCRVERAVDGDTLLLDSGHRVRLIGVDTPETKRPNFPVEPWGPEASAFTASLVTGRDVWLEYDRERLDAYRRVLAYVTVDGVLLNEELIRRGYSPAKTSFPYRSDMQRRFREAERAAKAAHLGIWSGRPPARAPNQ